MSGAAELVRDLRQKGIGLDVHGDNLEVSVFTENVEPEVFDLIRANKLDLIAYIQSLNLDFVHKQIPIVELSESYPVSDAQRRLWILSQFEGGSESYNMPDHLTLNGKYNSEILQKAIIATIDRHEILRTNFKEDVAGELRQWISTIDNVDFQIDYQDYRNEPNPKASIESYIREDSYKAFDLEKDLLLRVALLQFAEEEFVFYFNIHHIICDGWSIEVLSHDVFAFYQAFEQNSSPELGELRIQYKDYAIWQQQQLNQDVFIAHKEYWGNKLSGNLSPLNLPFSKPRPKYKTHNGQALERYFDKSTAQKLKAYSKEQGGTLFMTLLAAWKILMSRYTGQKQIITGTPMAGREQVDLKNQIGFYANTIAIKSEIFADDDFNSFFQRLQKNTLEDFSHQSYPFDRLVDDLNLQRDTSRNAIFDVIFSVRETGNRWENNASLENGINKTANIEAPISRFDIDVTFEEVGEYVRMKVIFNPDIYSISILTEVMENYQRLLNAALVNPTQKTGSLEYVSDLEKEKIIHSFNTTWTSYDKEITIVDLFYLQATKTPDAIALTCEGKQLSYKILDEKSNQFANYLLANYQIEADDLVGVKLERNEWLVITILAILKTGGAYVPIDPEYPKDRIAFIEEDSNVKVCIDKAELTRFSNDCGRYASTKLDLRIKPSQLAYVIYTSGSTGKPKGVMVEHGNLMQFFNHVLVNYQSVNRIVQPFIASAAFDISIFQLFTPLLTGGESIILDNSSIQDPEKFVHALARCNVIDTVPSMYQTLLNYIHTHGIAEQFAHLEKVFIGGDRISDQLLNELSEIFPLASIIVTYGPTEGTIFCTDRIYSSNLEANELYLGAVIGSPNNNVGIYVLNESQTIEPIGVIGEICIGGGSLARGYLNRPELTSEKFIANPLKENERLYKTGDLGRWLHNGEIEFIGRADDQVKIRGFRIELGEIENELLQNQAIEGAVVCSVEGTNGESELVAYITSELELNSSDLRKGLSQKLPHYMIPGYFVQLKEFPLSTNGKIDKNALPHPKGLVLESGIEYVPPRNELEQQIARIWEQILERDQIGVNNNFFDLGGNSLKLVRLNNEYTKQFSLKIPINQLFTNTSIALHAELFAVYADEKFIEIKGVEDQRNYAISDAQRRIWVLSQFEESSIAYNIPSSIVLNDEIDVSNLKKAVKATIDRHEALRTIFKEDDAGEIRQWILNQETTRFEFGYQDYRNQLNPEEKAKDYINSDQHNSFDLCKGPLFRAALLQVEDQKYIFYYNVHHIISDAWSMEVLAKGILAFYEDFQNNRSISTPELRVQYKDYSAWQLKQLDEPAFKDYKEFWLNELSGELPLLNLPSQKMRPKVKTHNGYALSTYIDKETTAELKAFAQSNTGSLYTYLLTVWNVLMYRYTAEKDIITGVVIAGRDHPDLENQIGCYINSLALRNRINPNESFEDFYQFVTQRTFASFSNQMYPFDRLVDDLNLLRDTSRSVVFDVMLMLQNQGKWDDIAALYENEDLNRVVELGNCTVKYDAGITFKEENGLLSFHVEFNVDVYEKELFIGLMNHFKQLIKASLENPTTKISELDYLSKLEKIALLESGRDDQLIYPQDKTIVDLFEEQVTRTPESLAISFQGIELNYQELNDQSNQLAHFLVEVHQIKPGDIVGIILERTEKLIITILGILKSGAAYLPIDINTPEERIRYISSDSNLAVLIDEKELLKFQQGQERYPKANIGKITNPKDAIYVIYTSGSTGLPKGVIVEHRNLVAHIHNVKELYGVSEKSRFLQFFNTAFDAAAQEIFTSLCFGASLYLKNVSVEPDYIYDLLLKHKITHADFSTAFFNSFIALYDTANFAHQLEFCAIGGEKLEKEILEKQRNQISRFTKKFYNVYGPTETTLTATWYPIIVDGKYLVSHDNIPIGKAYAGRQILILDENNRLLPKGAIGEICIGGIGVARGYLNRDVLTKEKFIIDPFKSDNRLYKTGDLGKWLPDGNLGFIGRKDDQVKIRGYRIELGEVEQALLKYSDIEQVLVLANANENGEKELVAYFKASETQKVSHLREHLGQVLPDYMFPSYFVQLEEFPLTPNGKIDKKSLPAPKEIGVSSKMEHVEAQSKEEQVLVDVWSEILKRDGISVKDSFYNLGGDSIKSIQVVARLKQRGYHLKVEDILRTPVLESLALLLNETIHFIEQDEVTGPVRLTPIQRWFFESGEIQKQDHFNQSVVLKSNTEIDRTSIEKCLIALTEHHDALRMTYNQVANAWEQTNQSVDNKSYSLEFHDLREVQNAVGQISEKGYLLQLNMSLSNGPLLRVAHFRLKDGDRLALVLHHLVVDGVSWRILLEDLSTLYAAYQAEEKPELPLKTDAFQKWALHLEIFANSPKIESERAYWNNALSQSNLQPLGKQRSIETVEKVDAIESFVLDKTTTELLQTKVHDVYNTEINDLLLTALGLAIKETFKSNKTVLQMEGHGREDILEGIDIKRTVGWFTTVYPFELDVSKSENEIGNLIEVKEALRAIPNKGIGYGILKYLNTSGLDDEFNPQIVFNYLGDFGRNTQDSTNHNQFQFAPETIGSDIASENENARLLNVSGMLINDELRMSVRFSSARFDKESISALSSSYKKNLIHLIDTLANSTNRYLTPSDLSFKGLSLHELNTLNRLGNLEDVYELSPLQQGMYYHWLSSDESALYLEQTTYRIKSGGLSINGLQRTYDRLVERHAVLRTYFSNDYAGKSLQIVSKDVASSFTYETGVKSDEVERFKLADRARGFNLEAGSQMRLLVIELTNGDYEFVWSYHHIIMDGWCISVLMNDFNELLTAELNGTSADLPSVVPYKNYINWLKTIDKEKSLTYWNDYLLDYSELADIPFQRNDQESGNVESNEFIQIEETVTSKIEQLCNENGITLNTFLQGVWGYLLAQYNGTNDVVFGAVVSGRPAELHGVEDMIGLFNNTIPIRVNYSEDDTPVTLLKKLQEQFIESSPHHYLNLSEVQSQSDLGMNLMNHIMVFENYAVKEMQNEGILNAQNDENFSVQSMEVFDKTNYNFNLTIDPTPPIVSINIRYNSNYYDSALIGRIKQHFDGVIKEFTENSNQLLGL